MTTHARSIRAPMRTTLFAGLLVVSAMGCDITDNPWSVIVIAVEPQTAAVGDLVTVTYIALAGGGAWLSDVHIDWGDGEGVGATLGGVEADGHFEHAYSEAGSYTIRGRANLQSGEPDFDRVTVQIN